MALEKSSTEDVKSLLKSLLSSMAMVEVKDEAEEMVKVIKKELDSRNV